jgi:hypothetical protein
MKPIERRIVTGLLGIGMIEVGVDEMPLLGHFMATVTQPPDAASTVNRSPVIALDCCTRDIPPLHTNATRWLAASTD